MGFHFSARWPGRAARTIVTPFDPGKQAGYCGASARIKFDDEQFAALFNELQVRGDKAKLNDIMDNVERLEKRSAFLRAHEKKMERIALIKAVHEERKAKM